MDQILIDITEIKKKIDNFHKEVNLLNNKLDVVSNDLLEKIHKVQDSVHTYYTNFNERITKLENQIFTEEKESE